MNQTNTGPADLTAETGPADLTAEQINSLTNAGALMRAGAYDAQEAVDFLEASHAGDKSREEWIALLAAITACSDCQA
jgi:hypothetical protein